MLRGEVRWFPRFLELCRDRYLDLSSDHPRKQVLKRILDCDSYRRVRFILDQEKDHWLRYDLFQLRTRARLQTDASEIISVTRTGVFFATAISSYATTLRLHKKVRCKLTYSFPCHER